MSYERLTKPEGWDHHLKIIKVILHLLVRHKIFTERQLKFGIVKDSPRMDEALNALGEKEIHARSQFERCGYYDEKVIHLGAGGPGSEILQMLPPLMEKGTNIRMKQEVVNDSHLFQYGVEEGDWQFLTSLSDFLSHHYGEPVNKSNLFLTAGASSGLWNILSIFFSSGCTVFVEDPTYFLGLCMFKDFKANIITVKHDENGIITEDLEQKFQQHFNKVAGSASRPLSAVLYMIPTFHNPTGATLSAERSKKVVELVRQYDVLTICDDVYNILHYGNGKPPRRLFSFDNPTDANYKGNVISNGSFSKIFAPGLRIGWFEAPEWVVSALIDASLFSSGGGANTYVAGILTVLMSEGLLSKQLEITREIYKDRMETVTKNLEQDLPEGCSLFFPPKGGYFVWIKLPLSMNSRDFLQFTKEKYQITFACGDKFSPEGNFKNFIRIAISFYNKEILISAVKKLCTAIKNFQKINTQK